MAKKSTKAEIEERVHTIYQMRIAGKSKTDICRFSSAEWGVTERQAERYIAKAQELVRDDYQMDRKQMLAEVISRYEKVYEKAFAKNQLSNCIGALSGISRLTGLEPDRK